MKKERVAAKFGRRDAGLAFLEKITARIDRGKQSHARDQKDKNGGQGVHHKTFFKREYARA